MNEGVFLFETGNLPKHTLKLGIIRRRYPNLRPLKTFTSLHLVVMFGCLQFWCGQDYPFYSIFLKIGNCQRSSICLYKTVF